MVQFPAGWWFAQIMDLRRASSPSLRVFDAAFDQNRAHGKQKPEEHDAWRDRKDARCHDGVTAVEKPNANSFSVRRDTSARAAMITAIHLRVVI
jgi:hypothetical protein